MEQVDGARRELQAPAYPDDTGAVPAELATALASYDEAPAEPGRYAGVLAALQTGRLLVPVVAVLGEAEVDEAGRTPRQVQ